MKIIAANWKLNKSPQQARDFFKTFKEKYKGSSGQKVLFFPPAVSLEATSQSLSGTALGFGFQNISAENSGAFTGENSASMGLELGARYALVGHSERRAIFGESSLLIHKKLKNLLAIGVTPIHCVGETLEDRDQGRTEEVIKKQIESELIGVTQNADLILAYEPVWAIGTGRVASLQQIAEVHSFIHGLCPTASILYGGSVKPDNSKDILKVKFVDGLLIGGASLEVDSLLKICESVAE